MKALIIGRHAPDFTGGDLSDEGGSVEVIECRDVLFPDNSRESAHVLRTLLRDAQEMGAVLLLQNTPGQVAAALVSRLDAAAYGDNPDLSQIGIIVSVPTPAEPGKPRAFRFSHIEWLS